jgi:hypothetical protein
VKVIIEGKAYFNAGEGDDQDDVVEVPIEVRGPGEDELEDWAVLLVHPRVSLMVSRDELERALRVFERRER